MVHERSKTNRRIILENRKNNGQNNDYLDEQFTIVSNLNKEINLIDVILSEISVNVKSLTDTIAEEKKVKVKLVSDIKVLQWDRRKKGISIHTQVERILEKHGVTIQSFHGGSLTGGAIIKLLNNHNIIMDDITTLYEIRINERLNERNELKPSSIEYIREMLTLHRKLFKSQDAVYANLRLIKPTLEEKIKTRERIRIMQQLWYDMELSCTPKAHLIFEHAADDQDYFDGLGDKIEYPLEKRH